MTNAEPKTSNDLAADRTDLAGERTDLAVKRTAMAASRTMMAWDRTGTSLISFGFAIHKILQTAVQAVVSVEAPKLAMFRQHSARRLGLMLIFLGTASIVMGTVEYFSTVKQLNEMSGKGPKVKWNLSLAIGALVGLLGLFLFITILANREVL